MNSSKKSQQLVRIELKLDGQNYTLQNLYHHNYIDRFLLVLYSIPWGRTGIVNLNG